MLRVCQPLYIPSSCTRFNPGNLKQLFYISEIVYFTLIGLIKIAFLLFFLQIFPQKRFRAIIWGIVIFNIATTISFAFAVAFICSPISFMWKRVEGGHEGHCGNSNTLAFSHAGISILLDFTTLALPIAQIWGLHLKTKKKIEVILMFSVGAL